MPDVLDLVKVVLARIKEKSRQEQALELARELRARAESDAVRHEDVNDLLRAYRIKAREETGMDWGAMSSSADPDSTSGFDGDVF